MEIAKLTEETTLNAKAVEKLIEIFGEHDNSIRQVQTLLEMLTARVDTVKRLEEQMTGMAGRISMLEHQLASYNQTQSQIHNRLGSVELDAGIDNQLYHHNMGVTHDWRDEADAGINSDMIPLSQSDIRQRYEKYSTAKKR